MFSAAEIANVVKTLGQSPVAKYADAHQLYPTVDKLIKLAAALKSGGVLMHLTDLEAEAITATRNVPQSTGPQPPPGALESSQT